MAGEHVPQVMNLYRIDEDDDEAETWVARVLYDADGRLEIVEALPAEEDSLEALLDSVNDKAVLVEKLPPGEDAEAGAGTRSRVTERGAPGHLEALQRFLRHSYDLALY